MKLCNSVKGRGSCFTGINIFYPYVLVKKTKASRGTCKRICKFVGSKKVPDFFLA